MATHPESFDTNASWYTKLTNKFPLMIDDESVHTTAFAFFFKEDGKWKLFKHVKENWQYVNAIFSIRVGLPFSFFFQIRWSDNPNTRRQLLQTGIGYKQSGRFAIHFRFQSDKSAEIGYHEGMPNLGQATGFTYGQK